MVPSLFLPFFMRFEIGLKLIPNLVVLVYFDLVLCLSSLYLILVYFPYLSSFHILLS